MDIIAFLSNSTVRDISAGAIVVAIVLLIITGRLIPLRTHNREMSEVQTSRDSWKTAHTRSEDARQALAQENYKLLETARLKLYPEPDKQPTSGGA